MGARPREWIRRYLPMEVAGTVFALAAAATVARLGGGPAHAAVAGTVAETVGFYGVAAFLVARNHPTRRLSRTARDLAVEFGPAEALDSLLLRPGLMYLGARSLGDLTAGVLVGKLVADVAFYLLAIAGHELGRRWFPPAPSPEREAEPT
jgi:hypothetical protein